MTRRDQVFVGCAVPALSSVEGAHHFIGRGFIRRRRIALLTYSNSCLLICVFGS